MIWKSQRKSHFFAVLANACWLWCCAAVGCLLLVVCWFFVACLLLVLLFVCWLSVVRWLFVVCCCLLLVVVGGGDGGAFVYCFFPQVFEVYFLPFLLSIGSTKHAACLSAKPWLLGAAKVGIREISPSKIIGIRENDPPHHATSTSLV